jgi:hypothetical protein
MKTSRERNKIGILRNGGQLRLRIAAAAAVLVFLGLILRYWHPVYGFTAFIQLDHSYDNLKIAEFRQEPVFVYPKPGPYDGIAYSQIAYHPLLGSAELRPAIDNLGYRARRILPSALAWLLAAGRPGLIAQVYAALNPAAWLILAAVLWRLLPVEDVRGAIGWAGVLFSSGALMAVRFALTYLIALVLLASAMLALETGRRGRGLGWVAAAALTRETSLVALPGFWTAPWLSASNLRRTALAALPLAAWMAFIWIRIGPPTLGVGNFEWPGSGFVGKWRAATGAIGHLDNPTLAWLSLLATFGLTVQAGYVVLRPKFADAWSRMGLAYVVLLLLIGGAVWEGYPGAAQRVLLPLVLAFNVLAVRRRAPLVLLLVGNLGVLSGLYALTDHPYDDRELLAQRRGSAACIIRLGDGWFDRESGPRHLWAWSAGDSRLDFESWPRTGRTLEFGFRLFSLAPRTVVIREGGRELWRGAVGPHVVPVQIPVATASGHAQVEFDTPEPGVPENANPDARRLTFGLYDPVLVGGP